MENRKIISIEVENLFNIYNHKINLKDGGITIIYGPNGVGKTILLSMVHAFFSKNFSLFEKIPFTSFTISTTRETIIIYRHQNYLECLIGNKSTKIKFIDEGLSRIAKRIERRIPFLEQIADDSWLDLRTDELLSSAELVERYSEESEKIEQKYELINNIIDSIHVFFIKTQRLQNDKKFLRYSPLRRKTIAPESAVTVCSEKMKQILGDALANYAKISQQLDKTFPNRLLSREIDALSGSKLKDKMEQIERKRRTLTDMNILPNTEEGESISYNTLNIDELDENNRQVLSTYAEDSEKKLISLEILYQKVRLMLDNINGKFKNKKLSINVDDGLVLYSNNNLPLNLSNLSSGEQHELVLMFNLLFNTQENSLILIDEPEISLHILWQKDFIKDIKSIINITHMNVIVATHSPSITEGYSNIMVGLNS